MPSRRRNSQPYNRSGKRSPSATTLQTNRKRSPGQTSTRSQSQRRVYTKRKGTAVAGARKQLKGLQQASFLAVAITGFLLTFLAPSEAGYTQSNAALQVTDTVATTSEVAPVDTAAVDTAAVDTAAVDTAVVSDTAQTHFAAKDISDAAKNEALGTLRKLWNSFYANLPKLLVAIAVLFFGWLFTRFLRWLLRKMLGNWEGSGAAITLTIIGIWLFIIGVAISVVAGDIRALIGSIGLIGLALSWSLQVPIESFTGWLLNSFRGYYRIGDRIRVGEVYGDVYRIDFLTTTVWEIGAPFRAGFVQAEQPTGLMVSFPNNEILSGTVVNFTSDFPYVWDELAVGIANESDIRLAMQVIEKAASDLLKDYMEKPAKEYAIIIERAGLEGNVSEKPEIFVSANDSWTDIIVRYLVGARQRRKWKSELTLQINDALAKPEYKDKIISVYPRQQIQMINAAGMPDSDEAE